MKREGAEKFIVFMSKRAECHGILVEIVTSFCLASPMSSYLCVQKTKKKLTCRHCSSAVELTMNRTTRAKMARRARIIRLPSRLVHHDVEVELLFNEGDDDRPSAVIERGSLVIDVRSFNSCCISSVNSGNNSQKIGS